MRIRIPNNDLLLFKLFSNFKEKKNVIKPIKGNINAKDTLNPLLIFDRYKKLINNVLNIIIMSEDTQLKAL